MDPTSYDERNTKMARRHQITILVVILLFFQFFACTTHDIQLTASISSVDVILFYPGKSANGMDILTFKKLAQELGLSTRVVDHRFINNRKAFFDKNGGRNFKVLILPGGEPYAWFKERSGTGIDCPGVRNILEFIELGGSLIAMCICSPSIFATRFDWANPNWSEAQRGEWSRTQSWPGAFEMYCGIHAFKGALRGPQETNKPYPKNRMLPIRMNPAHEIVTEFNLPPVIYQLVVGGGSIIPDEGQPLDVVGWYPNGTAAIGIVPYGKGRIIMSNPHPNITGPQGRKWRRKKLMGDYARHWGWTEEMLSKELKRPYVDPDGPNPDWALAKAMLAYAYKKASE